MSRIDCNIVRNFGQFKRPLLHLLLSMLAITFILEVSASAQTDSWRRTAKGWERTGSWNYLLTAPVGKLRPLTFGTLIQRSWPATFAALELSLLLVILHFGGENAAIEPEEHPASPEH